MNKQVSLTKYDSKFEKELHTGVLKDFTYHAETFHFTMNEKYTPDFSIERCGRRYHVEGKGYIYTQHAARKFVVFRETLKSNEELVFCFVDPNKEMKWQSKRKDGTRMSHFEWCEHNNFRWYQKDSMFLLNAEILKLERQNEKEKKHYR